MELLSMISYYVYHLQTGTAIPPAAQIANRDTTYGNPLQFLSRTLG
jgi:hypothetical protein